MSSYPINCDVVHALDDHVMIRTTRKNGEDYEAWIPRSLINNGDKVEVGDTQIELAAYVAEELDLV